MIEILAPMLIRYGAPVLGGVLREAVGGRAVEAGARVVEALGEAFGVRPEASAVIEAIEKDPKAQEKIKAVEAESLEKWIDYLSMATSQRNEMLKREDSESPFHKSWRAGMCYLVIAMWAWAIILLPFLNAVGAVVGFHIDPPHPEHLMAFSALWLTIYGGGHTMKSILGKA